jgi:uncharacterized membrane protein YdjX (TVP38/TMEM64 family)
MRGYPLQHKGLVQVNRVSPRKVVQTKNLLLLVVVVLVLAGFWWKAQQGFSRQTVLDLVVWVESYGWTGWVVFIVIMIAACMSGILPASMFAVAAGWVYGLALGFLLCVTAILTAAYVAFLLSRYVMRDRFQALETRFAVLARFDGEIAASGWKLVFMLRMSPLSPFGLVSYAFGLTRIGLLDYTIGTLSSLPSLLAFVYAGTIAGEVIMTAGGVYTVRNWIEWVIFISGFVATLASVFYLMLVARRALTAATRLPDE